VDGTPQGSNVSSDPVSLTQHSSKIGYCICCIFFAVMIPLGIFDIVIFTQSQNWQTPASIACPAFPENLTYYEAKRDLFSFHATYNFNPYFNGLIQFICASYNLDIKLMVNDQLAVRTNRKIISTISESHILDCHGDLLYITRAGDAWDAIINSNKISVSLEVHSPNNEVLAYIQGTHFFGDEVSILDTAGNTVAELHRSFGTVPAYWSFTILDPEHPGSDPRLLGVLAGMRDWLGKNPDQCNRTFWGVVWTWLVVGIIIVLVVLCVGGIVIKNQCLEGTFYKQVDTI
jgi:hypothetical protein